MGIGERGGVRQGSGRASGYYVVYVTVYIYLLNNMTEDLKKKL